MDYNKEQIISNIKEITEKCINTGLRNKLKEYTVPCMREYQLRFNPTADNRNLPWTYLVNEINTNDKITTELQDFIDSYIREANQCYRDNNLSTKFPQILYHYTIISKFINIKKENMLKTNKDNLICCTEKNNFLNFNNNPNIVRLEINTNYLPSNVIVKRRDEKDKNYVAFEKEWIIDFTNSNIKGLKLDSPNLFKISYSPTLNEDNFISNELRKQLKIESKLFEASRNELLAQTKEQTISRYKRSEEYKGFYIYDIDTSNLFTKQSPMLITCRVGKYHTQVEIQDVLLWVQLRAEEDPNKQINTKNVNKALSDSIDGMDIKVNCECGDWCLEENTKIKLLNGEVVTIKQLKEMFDNNEEIWVYSTDEKGDFKPGKVEDVWISGYSKEMIKVTLDNDKEILTTSNHKYMLRDGSYKEAKDLKPNDSLMPLYFSYSKGYENVKRNSINYPTKFDSVYKIVANSILYEEIDKAKIRSNEECIVIHHKDFNKLNNYPSNLHPMGKLEHWYYHSKLGGKNIDKLIEGGKRFWRENPRRFEAREKQKKAAREYQLNMWKNFNDKERQNYIQKAQNNIDRKKLSLSLKNVWNNYSKEEKENRLNKSNVFRINNPMLNETFRSSEKFILRNKKISEKLNNFHKTTSSEQRKKLYGWAKDKTFSKEHKDKITKSLKGRKFSEITIKRLKEGGLRQVQQNKESRCRRNLDELLQKNLDITPENFLNNRKGGDPHYLKVFNSFEEMLDKFNIPYNINHKVKKVEYIHYKEEIPVYDINVKDYHNFYVDAGVILHNCYRFAYMATQLGYKYGQPENRPAKIRNPHDYGALCKHLTAMLSNKKWIQQVTSTLMDFIVKNIDKVNEFLRLEGDEQLTLPNELARRMAKQGFYTKFANRNEILQNIANSYIKDSENKLFDMNLNLDDDLQRYIDTNYKVQKIQPNEFKVIRTLINNYIEKNKPKNEEENIEDEEN